MTLMPGCGWLRLTLPPGWLGFCRLCCRTVVPEEEDGALVRALLPPRAGWPVEGRVCVAAGPESGRRCCCTEPRLTVPLLPVLGMLWRVVEPLLLLRALLPLRLGWPPPGVLREMEGWLLRGVELRPFVFPAEPEPRICEEGADIEEEGRPPPLLLRELPPPEPLRELLPPLVWASRGTAIMAAAAMAIRESVVKRFIIV